MIHNVATLLHVGDIYKDCRTNMHYMIVGDKFSSIEVINLDTGSQRTIFYEAFVRFYEKVV